LVPRHPAGSEVKRRPEGRLLLFQRLSAQALPGRLAQAGGPEPRVTVAVWLTPCGSVQVTETDAPGLCATMALRRARLVPTDWPLRAVMVELAVIPAAAAGLPGWVRCTLAPPGPSTVSTPSSARVLPMWTRAVP